MCLLVDPRGSALATWSPAHLSAPSLEFLERSAPHAQLKTTHDCRP